MRTAKAKSAFYAIADEVIDIVMKNLHLGGTPHSEPIIEIDRDVDLHALVQAAINERLVDAFCSDCPCSDRKD